MGIYVGFWDTVLTDQDGFARLYADGTRQLARARGLRGRWVNEDLLIRIALVVPLAIVPILLFLVVGEPVTLLKTAGIIEAVHIPIVTALVLYLNHRSLPRGLRASVPVFWLTVFAGFFLLQELGAI